MVRTVIREDLYSRERSMILFFLTVHALGRHFAPSFTRSQIAHDGSYVLQVALQQGTTLQLFYEEEIMKCYGDQECNEGAIECLRRPLFGVLDVVLLSVFLQLMCFGRQRVGT